MRTIPDHELQAALDRHHAAYISACEMGDHSAGDFDQHLDEEELREFLLRVNYMVAHEDSGTISDISILLSGLHKLAADRQDRVMRENRSPAEIIGAEREYEDDDREAA